MDGWKITSTTRIIHGCLPSVISAQEYIYYFTEIWDDVMLNFHSPSLGLIQDAWGQSANGNCPELTTYRRDWIIFVWCPHFLTIKKIVNCTVATAATAFFWCPSWLAPNSAWTSFKFYFSINNNNNTYCIPGTESEPTQHQLVHWVRWRACPHRKTEQRTHHSCRIFNGLQNLGYGWI